MHKNIIGSYHLLRVLLVSVRKMKYLKSGNYVLGKKEGVFKKFYNTGELEINCIYNENKNNGEYIRYYKNGKIDTKGIYVEGLKHGIWEYFDQDGLLLQKIEYNNGYEK